MSGAILDNVEHGIRLFVDTLQPAIGCEHVQPLGIEQVYLPRIIAQRRKARCIGRNVKSPANAFIGVQWNLRGGLLRTPAVVAP